MLPLMMKIKKESFLVVGCGKIAMRKIESLLSFDIKPTVLCPSMAASLLERVDWINALYDEKYLNNFDYVIAATNDVDINHDIRLACRKHNIKCSNVSCVDESDFFMPALIKHHSVTIALSTDGKAPGIAKRIKRQVSDLLTESLEETIYYIDALRTAYKAINKIDQIVTLYEMSLEQLRKEGKRYEIENWNKG